MSESPLAAKAATAPPAVDRSVTVRLSPAEAFALFTQRMRQWWPFAGHSCSGEQAEDVQFESRLGGAVTEVARDGRRFLWGTLTEWNPPQAFAMQWHPGLAAEVATTLRVSFTAVADGTRVHVLHDGWAARAADAAVRRDQYHEGWGLVLQAYLQSVPARRAA